MLTTQKGLLAESWQDLLKLTFAKAHKLNGGRAKSLRREDIEHAVQDTMARLLELEEKGKLDCADLGKRQAFAYTILRGKIEDLTKSFAWAKTNNFSAFAPEDGWETVDACDVQNFELEKVEYLTPADIVADRDYYLNRIERAVKLVQPAEREVLDSLLRHSADKGKVCAELRLSPAQLSRKMFKIREQVNS